MLKLLSLFSGIGAFEKALDNLKVDYELVGYCEFDKYASESYSAIHRIDKRLNLGDITKVDITKLEKGSADIITYGFPCQDISNAGKQKGFEDENGNLTRSGLFFYATAIIGRIQPQIAICENVKALTGKKFEKEFGIVLDTLNEMGYNNYWQVLNAKDYGIPQNRERVFIVSIRKDVDNGLFEFPKPIPLTLKLGDLLEKEVDEKYYLSERAIQGRANTKFNQYKLESRIIDENGVHPTILARYEGATTLVDETKSELKTKLCKELLDNGLVEEGDVIIHSYTNNRLNNGVKNMSRTECKEKLSPTLDTRCDCLGVVVKEPGELQKEVCNKAMEKGLMKPYDIIDYTYSTARLDEITKGTIKTKNGTDNQIANTLTCNAENFGVCVPCDDFISIDYECVKVREATKLGYAIAKEGDSINISHPNSQTRRGRVGHGCAQTITTSPQQAVVDPKICVIGNYSPSGHEASRIVHPEGISPTIKENHGTVAATIEPTLRIRKLTPKECWRLMGFDDEDVEKAAKVCSNSQLYKQAGNSIVVDVLEELFCMMLDTDGNLYI